MALDAEVESTEPPADGEVTPAKPAFSFRALAGPWLGSCSKLLTKFGLYAFLVLLATLIIAYPAYLLVAPLHGYAHAESLEATLQRIDIHDVRDTEKPLFGSNRHFDIVFSFAAENKKTYTATVHQSWPAPGLRRKLEGQYTAGESYTLYRTPGGELLLEDHMAVDAFLHLTALMGLILLASLVYYPLKLRLAARMREQLGTPSAATAKSVLLGQLLALLMACAFGLLLYAAPVVVPIWLYLGAYWTLALLLCLSLRLLVFEDPPPPPPLEKNDLAKRIAKA